MEADPRSECGLWDVETRFKTVSPLAGLGSCNWARDFTAEHRCPLFGGGRSPPDNCSQLAYEGTSWRNSVSVTLGVGRAGAMRLTTGVSAKTLRERARRKER